jgi:15-cis-phytoene synthase
MSDDLDDLIRRVDPDRWLSSRFIGDPAKRADVIAIYAYDHELARAPKVASNPLLGEIRLTWWREALDEIYEGRPVRHHPTARALAGAVRRHDLPRAPLEAMIDARYRELDAMPMSKDEAMKAAFGAGGAAAEAAIQVIEGRAFEGFADGYGGIWSLALFILEGRIAPSEVAETVGEVRLSMAEARTVHRHEFTSGILSAVAHATLAPLYASGRRPGPLEKQIRLTWAVARGRI